MGGAAWPLARAEGAAAMRAGSMCVSRLYCVDCGRLGLGADVHYKVCQRWDAQVDERAGAVCRNACAQREIYAGGYACERKRFARKLCTYVRYSPAPSARGAGEGYVGRGWGCCSVARRYKGHGSLQAVAADGSQCCDVLSAHCVKTTVRTRLVHFFARAPCQTFGRNGSAVGG